MYFKAYKIAFIFSLLHLTFEKNITAQYHFVEATIWRSPADSVIGWIDVNGWDKIPRTIRFRKQHNDSYSEFLNGCSIQKIKFTDGYEFTGYCGLIDSSHTIEVFGKQQAAPSLVNSSLFLQPLVQGKASLYKGVDDNGEVHFFFRVIDSDLRELHHFRYIYHEAGGFNKGIYVTSSSHMIDDKKYKQQMLLAFKDCEVVFRNLAEAHVNFTKKGLKKWFIEFNNCSSEKERSTENTRGVK